MKRLVVYANPTYDVIGESVRVGGPGLYAAFGAHIHGYEVAVYGAVGKDGHRAVIEYRRRGVRFEKLVFNVDVYTTRFRIEYHDDKRVMHVEEVGPMLTHVEERTPRIVAPVLGEIPRSVMKRLVKDSYLDIQGVVRSRSRGPLRLVKGACHEVLSDVLPRAIHGDINETGICFGEKVVEEVKRLSREGVELLITMGYRGLILIYNDIAYFVASWGPKSSDPTGMGDTFLAAYAAGREDGLEPLEAVRYAVVTCGIRASGGMPSREEVERHVDEVKVSRIDWDTVSKLLG